MANILLIDDDDILAEGVAETLRQSGHAVAIAPSGREMLSLVARMRPDLVLTDVLMPDMDGIEVIRTLRSKGYRMPVIAMSGGGRMSADVVLEMASTLGAAGSLSKPFTRKSLLEMIDRCLAAFDPGPVA